MRLKRLFNKISPAAAAATLTAALALPTAGAMPAATPAPDVTTLLKTETYWKASAVDAVIALRSCPETVICSRIVWFNPKDENLHRLFGIRGKRARTPEELTRAFCNFAPRMTLKQTSPTTGTGTLEARGMGITLNVDATLVGNDRITMHISKAFISKNDTWTRVSATDIRYPHCTPLTAPRPPAAGA